MFDTHTHTKFSFDSTQDVVELLERAKQHRLTYLAITDHLDLAEGIELNIEAYTKTLQALKERYPFIAIGIECGYANIARIAQILNSYPFEYVINSIHSVEGTDCYFPKYFEGKTKLQAYEEYYKAVLQSLDAPYFYTTVGHIGYVARNAPYPNRSVDLSTLKEVVDAILEGIIARGKLLEVNANICVNSPHTPDVNVLKRYYQKGGRLITYGSDAHKMDKLCQGFDIVCDSLKQIGFKHLYTARSTELTEQAI